MSQTNYSTKREACLVFTIGFTSSVEAAPGLQGEYGEEVMAERFPNQAVDNEVDTGVCDYGTASKFA